MRNPIVNLLQGAGMALQALAELAGGEAVQTSAAPTPAEGDTAAKADVQSFLAGMAQRVMDGEWPPITDLEIAPEVAAEGTQMQADVGQEPAPGPDDSVVPAAENGVPLLPCLEIDYQNREKRRRRMLRADPVQAMTVAAYWLLHLDEQPVRAEEWTRCVECVPGSASDRLGRAIQLSLSELQLYAARYDECVAALQAGKDRAEHMSGFGIQTFDRGDLLDADRAGRILFWLGDRPDVEALTDAPPATSDVTDMGPDHIDGPRGSALEVSDELVTLEELEQLHPLADDAGDEALPQDATQEIALPDDSTAGKHPDAVPTTVTPLHPGGPPKL